MFNPIYARTHLTEKMADAMEGRIIHKHVVILPDGREVLIDRYRPKYGGSGWLQYPFQKITFNSISELLDISQQ